MTRFKRNELFSWHFSVPHRIFALSILWLASACCKMILGADSEFQTQSPRNCFPPSVTHRNKYLTGQVFKRLQSYDWLQCLIACVEMEDCISYNLDAKLGTCELNNGGITQWGKECMPEKSLKFSQHLIFHQVKDKSFWTQWESWSSCSATCGNGEKRRQRFCIGSYENHAGCDGQAIEKIYCNNKNCDDDVDDDDDDTSGDDYDDSDDDDDDDDDDNGD